MMPATDILVTGLIGLTALTLATIAALRAWNGWLDFKKLQLASAQPPRDAAFDAPVTGGRIELADLKERVRKLEAIASGIDP